jgi:hypothetical protein
MQGLAEFHVVRGHHVELLREADSRHRDREL